MSAAAVVIDIDRERRVRALVRELRSVLDRRPDLHEALVRQAERDDEKIKIGRSADEEKR